MLGSPAADRCISYADLSVIGESYDNYQDLDVAVNARARLLALPDADMSSWDEVDVRGLLSAVDRLVADGELAKARDTLKSPPT